MSNLKLYKFSDLYTMNSGLSSKPEQAGHGTPFLSFSEVFDSYFLKPVLGNYMDTSVIEQEKHSILYGDIFLTRTSETIDELGMSSVALSDHPNATFSGFLKRLRPKQTNVTYPKFMAFYLRSSLFRKTMTNNAVLTLRASLNEDIFSYLRLLLPNYDQQVKIGDFLFLLNQKIELNHRINLELTRTAKTLYDYWFVQFDFPNVNGKPYKSSGGRMIYNKALKREIPEGWEVSNLNDFFSIASGFPFKSSTYKVSGRYKIITIKHVQTNFLDSSKCAFIDDLPKNIPKHCKLHIGNILISLTGDVARVCIVNEDNLLLNQRVGLIQPKSRYHSYCLSLLKSERVYKSLLKLAGGSNQKNLSPVDAVKLRIANPPEYLIKKFSNVSDLQFQKIAQCQQETKELIKLRDWLLPMLVNGQVKVGT